jgi:transcriptional regulator with XRE-family HTH domain
MNLRVQLKALLLASHCSQRALAERLNVSEGHVSQLLANDRNLTVRTLFRIARALERDLRITLQAKTKEAERYWSIAA